MVRDRDAAADCVQDAFCTAATQLATLRDPERLRPWLYAIVRNAGLRRIRHRRREQVTDELPERASDDAAADTVVGRRELAGLVADAAGGLSDRDRSVLELIYYHGLSGRELAEALSVSPDHATKMASRLRDTVERSLGALLVVRRAAHGDGRCPELAGILAGWDGRFTVLMRKRICRHIESCQACDDARRRLVSPSALLAGAPAFLSAPAELREQTLRRIKLTCADTTLGDTGATGRGVARRGARSVRYAAALGMVVGAALVWLYRPENTVAPAPPVPLPPATTQVQPPLTGLRPSPPTSSSLPEHAPAVATPAQPPANPAPSTVPPPRFSAPPASHAPTGAPPAADPALAPPPVPAEAGPPAGAQQPTVPQPISPPSEIPRLPALQLPLIPSALLPPAAPPIAPVIPVAPAVPVAPPASPPAPPMPPAPPAVMVPR